MSRTRQIYLAFALSGVAGLVYEVVWTRYLSLYAGHGAYAQVLVLSVFLGGMALGSMAVANLSKRLSRPLTAYVAVEGLLALFGLAFHLLFVFATELSYEVLFPAAGSAGLVGMLRWGIAGLLILPQSMLLGATFPLMASSLVRFDLTRPGRGVAMAYLFNTLGGAAGVLVAGFWMIPRFGLPGASWGAAVLNLLAAGIVWRLTRGLEPSREEASSGAATGPEDASSGAATGPRDVEAIQGTPAGPVPTWVGAPAAYRRILLTVSFGTALASFAYEIGWIRMLSLVLGSATHAFELMLSAFILGLALGAWLIRDHTDRTANPVRLLGGIQVAMGIAALLSLPLYTFSFDIMAALMRTLPGRPDGYALFNISRFTLCLLVMLPSTTLAGMTLPVITASLLRVGFGERAIGLVYATNTMGSVVGAGLAGLIALPLLGLKGLVIAAAALDALLGLGLLARSVKLTRERPFAFAAALGLTVLVVVGVGYGTQFTPALLTSGVYRFGDHPTAEDHLSLYYQDGRTATVSAHVGRSDGVIVLATNGKPDASIGPLWRMERRDTLPVRPIPAGRDFTTQVLAPLVTLAHHPNAVNVANIGHGSGMSAVALLTSEALQRLVTIEIEPLMVEGSLVFLPANEAAFNDPRATYVFDDAKSYFSYQKERFDVIFAEPSNPWVSGTASLFTKEFYQRAVNFLTDDGILGQWMQIYELNDDLFLSVMAALDQAFPFYSVYMVGDADVAIVARTDRPVGDPDWSVLANERVASLTAGAPDFTPAALDALLLFDHATIRPLLRRGIAANSDYRPILDVGAERARFDQTFAEGTASFGSSRVDLHRVLVGEARAPVEYATVPSYGLTPALLSGRAALLREVLASGGGEAPEEFPEWTSVLQRLRSFLETSTRDDPPAPSWMAWASEFGQSEGNLHWGTTEWVDTTFYRVVTGFLDRTDPPPEARAAVELAHAFSLAEWEVVARSADRLVALVGAGRPWVEPTVLLDMAVVGYLRTGQPAAARNAFEVLAPRTGRSPRHLRNRLLDALVAEAEAGATRGSGPGTR